MYLSDQIHNVQILLKALVSILQIHMYMYKHRKVSNITLNTKSKNTLSEIFGVYGNICKRTLSKYNKLEKSNYKFNFKLYLKLHNVNNELEDCIKVGLGSWVTFPYQSQSS